MSDDKRILFNTEFFSTSMEPRTKEVVCNELWERYPPETKKQLLEGGKKDLIIKIRGLSGVELSSYYSSINMDQAELIKTLTASLCASDTFLFNDAVKKLTGIAAKDMKHQTPEIMAKRYLVLKGIVSPEIDEVGVEKLFIESPGVFYRLAHAIEELTDMGYAAKKKP